MKDLCLSALSLLILNPETPLDIKINAENEIYKRFEKNKFSFEQFLYFESNTIDKRGYDINKYLIKEHPTMQDWVETYFEYIVNNDFIHDNILFSEVLLCNDFTYDGFINNLICKQIKMIDEKTKEKELINIRNLQLAKIFLLRQHHINAESKICDNAALSFVYDIYEDIERAYREEKINYNLYNGNKLQVLMAKIYYLEATFMMRQFFDRMKIHKFLLEDLVRLRKQRSSLNNSSNVDFEDEKIKSLLIKDIKGKKERI